MLWRNFNMTNKTEKFKNKVVTGMVRLYYANVFKQKKGAYSKPMYSVLVNINNVDVDNCIDRCFIDISLKLACKWPIRIMSRLWTKMKIIIAVAIMYELFSAFSIEIATKVLQQILKHL